MTTPKHFRILLGSAEHRDDDLCLIRAELVAADPLVTGFYIVLEHGSGRLLRVHISQFVKEK